MIDVFLYIIIGLLLYIATAVTKDSGVGEEHIALCVLFWPLWLIFLVFERPKEESGKK